MKGYLQNCTSHPRDAEDQSKIKVSGTHKAMHLIMITELPNIQYYGCYSKTLGDLQLPIRTISPSLNNSYKITHIKAQNSFPICILTIDFALI